MARITIYENNQALGIGGANRYSANDATSRALSNLGGTVAEVGLEWRQQQNRANEKAAARQENLDNLRLHSAMLDHEDRVTRYAAEQEANFTGEGADGAGYEKAVAEFADKDIKSVTSNFPDRDPEELNLRFGNASRGVLRKAGDIEFNTALKFQGDVSEKKVAGLVTKIATDPAAYDDAAKEWVEFSTSTNMDRPILQQRMAALGLAKLQRAQLEATAARDPVAFRAAAAGTFASGPAPDLPDHLKTVVNSAADAGVNSQTMLAIARVESDLNPNAGSPVGKDGKPMSSAVGMFQVIADPSTLQELGITEDQRKDVSAVAPALASYIKRKTDYMTAKGIDPTPGKQYMFWNLGPGVASSLLTARPTDDAESVIDRTLSKRSPAFRATYKRNIGAFFKPGMPVAEVVANYERKMSTAAKSVAGYVAASDATEDQAQKFFSTIMPGGAPLLGARDLGEVLEMARTKAAELSREQQSLIRGQAFVTGQAKGDPRDSSVQKDVNEFVMRQGFTTGLAEGDVEAHALAANITANVGFVPEAVVNAYSAALNGGDIKGKLAAYTSLADVQARNPGAYDATKMASDDRSRVNEYVALTTVSQLSPDDAVRRIDWMRSPEGRKQAEAQKAGLQSSRTAEIKELSENDIISHFDEVWTTSKPTDAEGKFLAAATDAYKEQYAFYREQGYPVETSKDMAKASLTKNWGSSRVAHVGRGRETQTFMPYPPEKAFAPIDGVGHSWISDQALNQATAFIERDYPKMAAKYGGETFIVARGPATGKHKTESTLKDSIGVKLIPDLQTAHEARSNKPRSYRLMVTLPDGRIDITRDRFTPDQALAQREAETRFREAQKNARDTRPALPLDLQGP